MRSVTLAFSLLIAPAALGQPVYRWIDDNGVLNYTNDKSKVPAGVKAETTSGAEITVVASGRGTFAERAPASTSMDFLTPAERASADQWRAAFKDAHARIARLEFAIGMDKQRLQAQGMPYRSVRGRYYRGLYSGDLDLHQRIESNVAELKRARADLDELERHASREAVPREWRQP